MSDVLLWLHPLMQVCAAVLGVWAMWQGMKRAAMLYGKKKMLFPWKQHVRLGTLALVLWILGGLGFYVTHAHHRPARRTCMAHHRPGLPRPDHGLYPEPLQEKADGSSSCAWGAERRFDHPRGYRVLHRHRRLGEFLLTEACHTW